MSRKRSVSKDAYQQWELKKALYGWKSAHWFGKDLDIKTIRGKEMKIQHFPSLVECNEHLKSELKVLVSKTGAKRCTLHFYENDIEGPNFSVICPHRKEDHHVYGNIVPIPKKYANSALNRCEFAVVAMKNINKRIHNQPMFGRFAELPQVAR